MLTSKNVNNDVTKIRLFASEYIIFFFCSAKLYVCVISSPLPSSRWLRIKVFGTEKWLGVLLASPSLWTQLGKAQRHWMLLWEETGSDIEITYLSCATEIDVCKPSVLLVLKHNTPINIILRRLRAQGHEVPL